MNPKYPIYVISKGRYGSKPLTVRSLEKMGVPFRVVVEPQEACEYAKVVDNELIVETPFSNLGQGSIPVRNFVWEHSISRGHDKHWILDDNIEDFNRLNKNTKLPVRTGATFVAAEEFTDRFENVGLSGFNYYNFCKSTDRIPAFYLNTRIYSCILIRNNLDIRWRGKYNEDTDLSIRVLKSGLCTILFNAFLAGKVTTQRMKGGNTDDLYAGDGRKKMAESLAEQHPDVARVVWKFNRWHHQVNYKAFKRNRLKYKSGFLMPIGINNFGMVISKR